MAQQNLRIIYDNAIARNSLFAADTTAGSLDVTNMLTDNKGDVYRSTQKSAILKARWSAAEMLGALFLYNCNLTDTATMRVCATNEQVSTNLLTYSEGTVAQLSTSGFATNDAAMSSYFGASIRLSNSTGSAYAYKSGSVTGGNVYTLSVFVKMDDGSAPVPASGQSNGTGDIMLVFAGAAYPGTAVLIGNGVYRMSVTITAAITATSNFGVVKYVGNSSKGLVVQGYQLEAGQLTSYYPTTSAAATRPLGYMDDWQPYNYDSGTNIACPGGGVNIKNWANTPAGANAYAYGGGAVARNWFPTQTLYYGIRVTLNDPNNTSSYLEVSRFITGAYWSPTYNAEYEAPFTPVDNTVNKYNDAGDLISMVGTRSKKQSISLSNMPLSDRDTLWGILWGNGSSIPLLFSLYPNDSSGKLERTHTLYGKLNTLSPITTPFYYRYSTTLEFLEA